VQVASKEQRFFVSLQSEMEETPHDSMNRNTLSSSISFAKSETSVIFFCFLLSGCLILFEFDSIFALTGAESTLLEVETPTK
jgi:hypothetical protein